MSTLRYPLKVHQGTLMLTDDYPTVVADAIVSCIQTWQGERVWVPGYGRDVDILRTVSNIPDVLGQLRASLDTGLTEYQDVSYSLASSLPDGSGQLTVYVEYSVPGYDPAVVQVSL